MITFKEALDLVLVNTPILPAVLKNVHEIDSDVLAEDIKAKVDLPVFSNSAMDGYALRFEDTHSVPVVLRTKGCIKAGDFPRAIVGKGEAAEKGRPSLFFKKGERVKIQILPWK